MTYKDFLNWLRTTGDNLPEILADIEVIIQRGQNIRRLMSVPEVFTAVEPTSEEAALEQEVIAAATKGKFAGRLQDILAFIRSHRELIALLLTLFSKS